MPKVGISTQDGPMGYLSLISYLREGTSLKNMVGGKKGNRTEPNRTNGLYRTEPTEISDCCGTGFYLRHRTDPFFVVVVALLFYVHGKHLRSCRDGQLT